MQIQRESERKIEKKRQEIAELKKQLITAETYLEGMLDMAKVLPRDGEKKETVLRAGTDLAKARDFIKIHGCPQHVTEILKGLGKEVNKANRISLSGSLGSYVRKGIIFTKPDPNTFGLIEMENTGENKSDEAVVTLGIFDPATTIGKPHAAK